MIQSKERVYRCSPGRRTSRDVLADVPGGLAKGGFYRHALAYRFAPLPTDTEFVKPSIFSGAWNPLQKSYEAILRERATNDWAGKRVVYLPNPENAIRLLAPSGACHYSPQFISR